ncbi:MULTISPECIES: hypothetical protein [Nitrosospira]|uniref:hypothetical protein n=1 Tax=Nitrosospira TaxID=35798 RepID=UPI000945D007|nr:MULTISPECIES: hypothetical protein [Nitrosospira]
MAHYQNASFLIQSQHIKFDKKYPPGTTVPDAGIYRCTGCGHEIVIANGQALPMQNQHQHAFEFGMVCWELIVCPVD